jgi:predicted TIM-barrel fold metal-dependent hydrolase
MATMIDLKASPVFDVHCFAYRNAAMTRDDLAGQYAMVGTSPPSMSEAERIATATRQGLTTGALNKRIKDLAAYLGTEATIDAVIAERERRREADFSGYVSGMLDDQAIKGLGVDMALGTLADVDKFDESFPGFVRKVYRLTTLVRDLLENSKNFENLVADYDAAMTTAARDDGAVAFKSIIAYRTGLDIKRVSEGDAAASFARRKEEPTWFGYRVKELRDFLLRRAVMNAIDLDAMVMIHTGLGDSEIVAKACSPINLWDLLRDDETMACKTMLIHGGFPYTNEAIYMTSVLPNLYFDLSAGTGPAFLEKAVEPERFRDILRSAPNEKIMYSSDAGEGGPETMWHDCLTAKHALGTALGSMVDEGYYTNAEAKAAGEDVLYNNAARVFGF